LKTTAEGGCATYAMAELFTLDNGQPLHLEEFCPSRPDSTTLVAVHGLGGAGYLFAGMGQFPGIRALCPDLPGNGLSPRPKQPITFDYFADTIVQLIQRKTTGRIALLGHSMGAIIALQVYAAIPDRIGSIIFVGGLPAPLPVAQTRLRERAALIRATGLAAVTPTIIPVLFAERAFTTIPDKVAMFTRILAQSDGEGYAQTAEALADASAADVATRVRIPCLCITGNEDRYAPPAAVRAFADSIKGAVYREIPNCGHMPFYETPEVFNGMIRSFLEEAK